MPIEEGAGCLAVILRVACGLVELLLDWGTLGEGFGFVGSWVVRLVTLGRCKPDPESWPAIILGILVMLTLMILAAKLW
jgi:hypothetical protein